VEAKVAEFLRIEPSELLLTNGVDEAIHLLCQTYLEPGDEALIVVPTYSMYRIYVMAAGAASISVGAGHDFTFPGEKMLGAITPRTRLIAIANPNNPTGTVAPGEELLQIACSAPDAAVLIDEAYFEFYGKTMLQQVRQSSNLFVARTFSKAYGMAGLRVGVLAGNVEQMRAVRRVSSPYNLNAVALACLPEALADAAYIATYVREVLESRARLEDFLEASGVPYCRSQANFILARIGPNQNAAAVFVDDMRRQGILLRDRSSDPGCEGWVRMTLGPRDHINRLLAALETTIAKLGVPQGVSQA
jgi:histidinol-phosphate aminotransferase